MERGLRYLGFCIGLVVANASCAMAQTQSEPKFKDQANQNQQVAPAPQTFADAAAARNRSQIEASEIALARSEEPVIQALARDIIRDHQQAQRELVAAANEQGISIVAGSDAEQNAQIDALRNAPYDQFGSTFLSMLAVAQQDAIDLHTLYGDTGETGALKVHATAQLSTLRTHLVRALSAADR